MLASSGDKHNRYLYHCANKITRSTKVRVRRGMHASNGSLRRIPRPPSFHYLVQSPIQFPSKRARINNVPRPKIYVRPSTSLAFFTFIYSVYKLFHKAIFFLPFSSFFFSFSRIKFLDKRSDTALRRPVTDLLCPFGSREISLELKIVGN